MANVFNLEGTLGLNTVGFKSKINEAGENLKTFTARSNIAANKVKKAFKGIRTAIGGVSTALSIGGALSFAGVAALANGAIEAANEIKKLAVTTGSTVEEIQALNIAFIESEMTAADVVKTLGKISVATSEAKAGVATYVDSFEMLGISVDDLEGKRPAEIFALIADAASKTEDPISRNAAVAGILGAKMAQKLVPALMDGANGFNEVAKRAKDSGVIMESWIVDGAANAADSMDKLNTVIKGGTTKTFALMGPIIESAADKLRVFISDTANFEGIFRGAIGGAVKVLGIFGNAWRVLEIVFLSVKVAALRFTTTFTAAIAGPMLLAAEFANAVKKYMLMPIHNVLELASMLPGVGDKIKVALEKFDAVYNYEIKPPEIVMDAFNSQHEALLAAADDLRSKAMEKIPSQAFDDWILDMEKATEKAKEASAAAEKLRLDNAAKGVRDTDLKIKAEGGKKLRDEVGKDDAKLAERILKQKEKLAERMLKEEQKNIDKMRKMKEDAAKEEAKRRKELQDKMLDDAQAFNTEISYTLGGEVSNVLSGNFKDIGSSFAAMLQDMVAQAVTADILSAIGIGPKGGGMAEGSFFSGAANFLGGFFADGGRPPINKVSVVGERGPELFVPSQQGTIIPNSALGGKGENKQVVNNFNISTPDANSFRSSRSRIASDISRVMR